jgi:hypothetical protein
MGQDIEVSARGTSAIACNVANGATISDAVDLEGFELVGIWIPSNFQGTTLTFQAAERKDGTFAPVVSGGAAVTVTVQAGRLNLVSPATTLPFLRFLKLVAGSVQNANVRLFLVRKQGA